MSSSRVRRIAVVVPTAALTLIALAACGSSSKKSAAGGSTGGAAPADLKTVSITVTSDGCGAAHESYNTGPLTFEVSNTNATGVTEVEVKSQDRILGEKENLAPGFKGTFSLNLQPGDYSIYCPGASKDTTALKITGTASSAAPSDTKALLTQGAKDYQGYVNTQIVGLTDSVTPLVAAIKANKLDDAQVAYAKARPFYERIEPVAESFPDLDPAIDARVDDQTPDPTNLTGFHRIEYGLFTAKSTDGLAPVGDELVANIAKLKEQAAALSGFQPEELANGAVGLLDEAATSKITGEEEAYSHIDLLDFAANVEGSQQAFAYLEDGLTKIDSALVQKIKDAFTAMIALLDKYKDSAQPSGYKLYTSLTDDDKKQLTQSLQAISEPLSTVAGKVANA